MDSNLKDKTTVTFFSSSGGFLKFNLLWPIKEHRMQSRNIECSPLVSILRIITSFTSFNTFLILHWLAHKHLSDCVVCGMMSRSQPQNKISSYVVPVSSTASITLHSIQGEFSCSLYCLAQLCVYHKRQHFAFRVFFSDFSSHFRQRRRRTLPVKPCPLLWQICAYFSWFCASSSVKQIYK